MSSRSSLVGAEWSAGRALPPRSGPVVKVSCLDFQGLSYRLVVAGEIPFLLWQAYITAA